ncbi:uncharacterized protein LOC123320430 [Coccinella septempunctata]|uniref:uncharacterized protein LOC123320430 n=1 Tax=Coccinella septempunctata TaxID=41139 RepID=UPI001D09920D|nr:uncharacterized protein LOC123320430 [Coccinella septempunctata]
MPKSTKPLKMRPPQRKREWKPLFPDLVVVRPISPLPPTPPPPTPTREELIAEFGHLLSQTPPGEANWTPYMQTLARNLRLVNWPADKFFRLKLLVGGQHRWIKIPANI